MEQEVLKLLVAAVEAIHSPYSTQEARLEAQEYLNRFVEQANNAAEYGVFLARSDTGCSDMVRHFGLHILDENIRYRWNNFSEEQQLGLRAAVMKLVEEGTKDILSETPFLKEKLVKAVVEVIKRHWPQLWGDLMPELTRLCSRGCAQKELVLFIMRTLAEDLLMFEQDTISTKRRSELMQGVINLTPDLLGFCHESIRSSMAAYQQGTGDAATQKIHEKLISAGINVFLANFNSVEYRHVRDAQLIPLLIELLQWPQQRVHAVECLLLLLATKRPEADMEELLGMFQLVPVLSQLLQSEIQKKSADEESLQFVKRLTQMMVLMFTTILHPRLSKTPNHPVPPNFQEYIKVLLMTVHHPSMLVTSFSFALWQLLYEKPIPVLESFASELAIPLLTAMAGRLEKQDDWDPKTGAYNAYNEADYDSEEKFKDFTSNLRGFFFKTTSFIALMFPHPSFVLISGWMYDALREVSSGAVPNKDDRVIRKWEVANSMADKVVASIVKGRRGKSQYDLPNVDQIDRNYVRVMDLLAAYQPTNVATMLCCLGSLNALAGINTFNTTYLGHCVLRGLQGIVFIQAGEGIGAHGKLNACDDTYEVRRASLRFLTRLAMIVNRSLLNYLGMVRQYADKWWNEKTIMWSERSQLYEMIFMISNAMPPQQQYQLVQELLTPLEKKWTSAEFAQVLASPNTFIRFLGVSQEQGGIDISDASSADREELLGITRIFHSAALRLKPSAKTPSGTTAIMTSHLAAVLPNLFMLIGCIHGMWGPSVIGEIASRYHPALQMGDIEAQWRLNMQRQPLDLKERKKSLENQDACLEHVRGYLEQQREVLYLMTREFFDLGLDIYQLPGLAPVLLRSFFADLNSMDLRHLKILVRQVIKPLVVKCPAECLPTILPSILSGFFDYMRQHLAQHWMAVTTKREAAESEGQGETGEILEEGQVTEVTRDTIEVPWALLFPIGSRVLPPPTVAPSSIQKMPQSPTEAFVINTPAIRDSLANLMVATLLWPDSTAAQKAAGIILHLTPYLLLACPDPNQPASMLITQAIRGLNIHGQHDELAGLIIRLIGYLLAVVPDRTPLWSCFLSLPSVSPAELELLQQFFLQPEGQRKTQMLEKTIRTVLAREIGKNVGQMYKKESTILDLPSVMFMDGGNTKKKDDENADLAVAIGSLFEIDD